jgi:hypothetical protein
MFTYISNKLLHHFSKQGSFESILSERGTYSGERHRCVHGYLGIDNYISSCGNLSRTVCTSMKTRVTLHRVYSATRIMAVLCTQMAGIVKPNSPNPSGSNHSRDLPSVLPLQRPSAPGTEWWLEQMARPPPLLCNYTAARISNTRKEW